MKEDIFLQQQQCMRKIDMRIAYYLKIVLFKDNFSSTYTFETKISLHVVHRKVESIYYSYIACWYRKLENRPARLMTVN